MSTAGIIARSAEPVLAFADRLAEVRGERQADLLRHAAGLLDRFSAALQRGGLPGAAVPPARAALALVLDQEARANPTLDVALWGQEARQQLFQGREISASDLTEYQRRAADLPAHRETIAFVSDCLTRLANRRTFAPAPVSAGWTGILTVLGVAYLLAVLAWASWVEWRFHRDLLAAFQANALSLGLDREGPFPDLAQRLDRLAAEAEGAALTRAKAPVTLWAGWLGYDAAEKAQADYTHALQQHLPKLTASAIGRALEREGEPAAAYDTLRAWSVLSGQANWQPEWLAGWALDRAVSDPTLAGLAPHLSALAPPDPRSLPRPDPELLEQARAIAAEAPEPERAYLELRRSPAMAALPGWQPDAAVPGLSAILRRKSGLSMDEALPGIYTENGWQLARDTAAGLAVQSARAEATRLFSTVPPLQNDTPDVLMDRLQDDTLARWSDYLADLRVREFTSPESSVLISGALARQASPLEGLMREVWQQTGGTDRSRSHQQQIKIASVFGPMIQYVETGRMQEISNLFVGLNVALAASDREGAKGQKRLMSVQDRASSVAALGVAPLVVVQLVEDTLAQSGAAQGDLLTNKLTRAWQNEVLEACLGGTQGRFPFADGPDADPAALQRLLAPGGSLDRFVMTRADALLDRSQTPWRWKPEGRFQGLSPESALFLQSASEIGQGLFPAGRAESELTLSALAERGRAFVALGGQGGPVEATSDSLVLAWPGNQPEAGIEVVLNSGAGEARLAHPGFWGLLRLLSPLRLRERDNGQRFLVDLKAEDSRLFMEIQMDRPQNPIALRKVMQGFACPAVL
ncbi:ImcF-related family protein [Xinfangfangia sp. CPCC 101601]|uniref:ImcF-related family protein n=1 Tax=Pseudogemmobacter lacusdianii TaxID=3069608 RepID=A0ABU0VVD9_9RHOB|nr:ImcF-related family protein [Xinfangfangia sp. CPCC 101601]MDQ2065702.1 ImcF-related family protein [Xinfangfangia sp. CPCC 101601]